MREGLVKRRKSSGIKRRTGIRTVMAAALISLSAAGMSLAGEPGWSKEEDGWYYYLEDGSPAVGWLQKDGIYYFLSETGRCLTDAMAPDGYYVDGEGAWYRREKQILGCQMTAPEKFASAGAEWEKSEPLQTLKGTVNQVFGGARLLKVTDTAVEYVSTGSTDKKTKGSTGGKAKETVLLGLYREQEAGQYRLDIRIKLDRECTDRQEAGAYNYGVFQALAYQISSSPEILEEALYSAWQGENQWSINRKDWVFAGDCQVIYTAGDGFGRFYIKARDAE